MVDGDRARARLDVDAAAPGLLRRPHGGHSSASAASPASSAAAAAAAAGNRAGEAGVGVRNEVKWTFLGGVWR